MAENYLLVDFFKLWSRAKVIQQIYKGSVCIPLMGTDYILPASQPDRHVARFAVYQGGL